MGKHDISISDLVGKGTNDYPHILESNNLKGKKIVPFCTSGGSGISGSMKGVKAAAKGGKRKGFDRSLRQECGKKGETENEVG